MISRPDSVINDHIKKFAFRNLYINFSYSFFNDLDVVSLNYLLHGREKMVASLIAAGAFAGAVTDPTSQDPNGKTAASIATSNGHKGLAGYLAEADLTSHLSSLTLEKCEVPKDSSELEAELAVSSVSKKNLEASDDEVSLKNTLGAVRNASLAAARIQAAFRAHSFKKRLEREASSTTCLNGYVNGVGSIGGYARSLRDCNSAALSIQKKYRGWKGRKEFLVLRQKVVKIQVIDVMLLLN
jgi:hypothetical protein